MALTAIPAAAGQLSSSLMYAIGDPRSISRLALLSFILSSVVKVLGFLLVGVYAIVAGVFRYQTSYWLFLHVAATRALRAPQGQLGRLRQDEGHLRVIRYRQLESWSPPCPICESARFQPLAGNDRYGMGVLTAGMFHAVLRSPGRAHAAAMATFYRDHYREYYQAISRPDAVYIGGYHKDERLGYTAGIITANAVLAAGMRVLDVGCAEGTLFAKLAESCGGLAFVGVEPSEGFAAYARQATGRITYPSLDALICS